MKQTEKQINKQTRSSTPEFFKTELQCA